MTEPTIHQKAQPTYGNDGSRGKRQLPSLLEATSDELLLALDRNQITCVDLVNAYIARINEVNDSLHAVSEINPDAQAIAAQLDRERAAGNIRGPLHGLPVLIKGNIGTSDRMQTNAGSFALQDAVLPADSTIAAKLHENGLIILGKASLTEWSMFRSDDWPHAWNPIVGQTYGAYVHRQCPGGSSSGSAVAADLGLAWATIGTETSGSIVWPSSRNNIVGIKPTVGLTSRHLVVPVSEHQDTVGPMARTVKDAARLLQVIAGADTNDVYTSAAPCRGQDYLAACKESGLHGKRIGIARNVIVEARDEISYMIKAFEDAFAVMADQGATIIDNADFTAYAQAKSLKPNPVPRAEFRTGIAGYFNRLSFNPNNIHSLEDLRDFTREFPQEQYPTYNVASWDFALDRGISSTSSTFGALYRENLYIGGEGGVLGALERHDLDAIVLPSPVAFEVAALVGTPIITVPLGAAPQDTSIKHETRGDAVEMAPGVPFGICFLGAKWSEQTLIEIAFAFEQATMVRGKLTRHIEPAAQL